MPATYDLNHSKYTVQKITNEWKKKNLIYKHRLLYRHTEQHILPRGWNNARRTTSHEGSISLSGQYLTTVQINSPSLICHMPQSEIHMCHKSCSVNYFEFWHIHWILWWSRPIQRLCGITTQFLTDISSTSELFSTALQYAALITLTGRIREQRHYHNKPKQMQMLNHM